MKPCHCDGFHYPHRRGGRGCNHREEFVIERMFSADKRYTRHLNLSEEDIFGEEESSNKLQLHDAG